MCRSDREIRHCTDRLDSQRKRAEGKPPLSEAMFQEAGIELTMLLAESLLEANAGK